MILENVSFLPFIYFIFSLETLSSNSAIIIEIPDTQKESNEKVDVWNQNVLQEIALWENGQILIWPKVWASWQQEQVSIKI